MRLSKEQRKHVAGVLDKAAIAYFAVVGYTSYSGSNWMTFGHALIVFCVIEYIAVLVLRENGERDDS